MLYGHLPTLKKCLMGTKYNLCINILMYCKCPTTVLVLADGVSKLNLKHQWKEFCYPVDHTT